MGDLTRTVKPKWDIANPEPDFTPSVKGKLLQSRLGEYRNRLLGQLAHLQKLKDVEIPKAEAQIEMLESSIRKLEAIDINKE